MIYLLACRKGVSGGDASDVLEKDENALYRIGFSIFRTPTILYIYVLVIIIVISICDDPTPLLFSVLQGHIPCQTEIGLFILTLALFDPFCLHVGLNLHPWTISKAATQLKNTLPVY